LKQKTGIRILLFTEQPFVALGVAAAIHAAPGFVLASACDTLEAAVDGLRSARPDVVIVHLTSRIGLSELSRFRSGGSRCQMILWGDAIAGEFAFQAMQLGARAILPSNTSVDGLLTAVQNVHRGVLCFEKQLLDDVLFQKRVSLTPREGQIITLVAQGLKNKAIGGALGITEGTVKVYLYKLFKKLGVNDRLDMALYGLKHLFGGQASVERPPRVTAIGPATTVPFGPRRLPPQTASGHEDSEVGPHRVN